MSLSVVCAFLLIASSQLLLSSSAQGQEPASDSVSLYTPFPVPLAPSGFDPLRVRSVNVTLDTSDSVRDARVYFYRTSELHTTIANLPSVSMYLAPILYVRDPLNYYQADIPLYTVGGNSTIEYKVAAYSALAYSECPLEIFLFDDETEYDRFKNGIYPDDSVGRYLKRSGCLRVGKENEPVSEQTVKFYLNNQSFYFVAVSIEKGLKVNCSISGSVLEYHVSDLTPDDCSLSVNHLSCNLNISEGIIATSSTITYILACSTDLSKITYTVTTVLWNVWSVTWLGGFTLPLLILLLLSAILLALLCQRSTASKNRQYTKLSIQNMECQI